MKWEKCKKAVSIKKTCLSVLLSASLAVSGIGINPASVSHAAGETDTVSWVMSQEGNYMQKQADLTTTEWDADNHSELYIDVDENITYQEMAQDVWGGCFNERGWDKLMQLTEEERSHILDLLFKPDEPEGLHLTMARMPIGSSDYAMDMYSLDETEDDYELNDFSIARDQEKLIPYIKAALERQPNLKIWASPWSPPWWMKQTDKGVPHTIDQKNGGFIEYTPQNMETYAQYFRKFIEAYDAEGIEIYMVSPQNEPTMNTPYSSCVWSGEQLRDFIRDYLGPKMQELGVQIYLGTFTDSNDKLMDPTLNDVEARKYISGINFQWWSYNRARALYRTGFNQGMMQSETMCGDGNNNWQYAENQFDLMWMYLSNGISAYNLWNMVLEWDGTNPGGNNTAPNPWHQNAPITVNETTKQYSINPQYYETKHFTDAVQPGARRIESGGTYDTPYTLSENSDKQEDSVYCAQLREIAFRNPDGTISLLVKNGSDDPKNVDINFNGRKVSAELPAHSIHTFTAQGTPLTGAEKDMAEKVSQENIVKLINKVPGANGAELGLCINDGGAKTGANVLRYDYSGEMNQQWYIKTVDEANHIVKLVNLKSFNVASAAGTQLANVTIQPESDDVSQNWVMEDTGDGYVRFKKAGTELYMAINASINPNPAILWAWEEGKDDKSWKIEKAAVAAPTIESVSIDPESVAMQTGNSQQFTATVTGSSGAPVTVNWELEGNQSAGTKISRTGLLTVAADETASSLTVRATSTFDAGKVAKATVTVEKIEPEVVSVSVTPQKANVQYGTTRQFTAKVEVTGGAKQTVTWSVSGNNSNDTSISDKGLLTVAAEETAQKITVKAVSKENTAKYAEAEVTLTATESTDPIVESVSVTPKKATVEAGKTHQFTAEVSVKNGAAQTVTWSVSGNKSKTTTVSAAGLLTVAENETAKSLTVKAVSTEDESKFDQAAVTVTIPEKPVDPPTPPQEGEVGWILSQEGKYLQNKGNLKTTEWDENNHSDLYIDVDENITYQEMAQEVWGGCFNERGWHKLMQLTEAERNHILDLLFKPDEPEGLHLTMGRLPIGSSDFAMDLYSLDETKDDYELKDFSIARDKEKLIPYIKAALERQPKLKLWASPWTPPSWMKKAEDGSPWNSLIAGYFNSTEQNMAAYAKYFRKFIEAYKAEGIEISMVSPQNEPTMWTAYSSCVWTGEQLRDFIKGYLGPEMKDLGVEIYLGTFTNSDDSLMDPTLNDQKARSYISGINFQWWSYNKARSLYKTGFDLGMMQSETMCGDGNNNWQYAEYQFDEMWMYLSNGISAYNLWNMVLEWDGVNPGGDNTAENPWHQNAPITVNENTKKYTINPQFYETKHYTDAVKAGARRIESGGTYDMPYELTQDSDKEADSVYSKELREIAFRNPDGTIALLVKNGSNQAKSVDINFNGRKVSAELPAHSISTFTTQGTPLTGKETDMTEKISQDKIVSIQNAQTNQALCVDGGGVKSLANVISWDYSAQANQQWYLEPSKVGNVDTVKLVNIKSFSVAAVNGGTSEDGERLIIWSYTGGDDQNWIMEQNGEFVKFKNAKSGLYLTLENETAGAKAVQKAEGDSKLQLWKVGEIGTSGPVEEKPIVESVNVTPKTATVQVGSTKQFAAEVNVKNGAKQTVNWSITGNSSDKTKVSKEGLLTVAEDEAGSKLFVRAVSAADDTKYDEAEVTVTKKGSQEPEIGIICITLQLQAGKSQQFTAEMTGEGTGEVVWSIEGNKSAKTKITQKGLLTIGEDETAEKLKVIASSANDQSVFAQVFVTVIPKASEPKPVVESVSVSPKTITVEVGKTKQFTTKVTVKNGAPKTVTWSVSGKKSSKTKISKNGLLTVGSDEKASKLTVKATSTFNKSKYGKAVVTVKKKPSVPKKGSVYKVGKLYYKVTKSDAKNGTVTVTKPIKKTYTSITIPEKVKLNGYTFKITSISSKAFYANKKLQKVAIGNGVSKIGASAFASNPKLDTVAMGTGITTIESKAFYKDSKLKKVTLKSNKLKTVKKYAFKGIAKKAKIDVPNKKVKKYKALFKKAGLPSTATVK